MRLYPGTYAIKATNLQVNAPILSNIGLAATTKALIRKKFDPDQINALRGKAPGTSSMGFLRQASSGGLARYPYIPNMSAGM